MPQVSLDDAKKFSQVWTNHGVSIAFQDVHLQFAADFANIVIKSFIDAAMRAERARQEEILKTRDRIRAQSKLLNPDGTMAPIPTE